MEEGERKKVRRKREKNGLDGRRRRRRRPIEGRRRRRLRWQAASRASLSRLPSSLLLSLFVEVRTRQKLRESERTRDGAEKKKTRNAREREKGSSHRRLSRCDRRLLLSRKSGTTDLPRLFLFSLVPFLVFLAVSNSSERSRETTRELKIRDSQEEKASVPDW